MTSSKSETIDAILTSAISAFAYRGFDGASLRDIATEAGVPHSTINHYYGSKRSLFSAAILWTWDDIDAERSRLLSELLAQHPAGPVPLKELLHSLAYPAVRRALSKDDFERAQIVLLTQNIGDIQPAGTETDRVDRSVGRWISAIERTCPTLSHEDVIWAFSFCVGVIYSWQLTLHRYDDLLDAPESRTAEQVAADIVAFAAAGIEAIVEARSSD